MTTSWRTKAAENVMAASVPVAFVFGLVLLVRETFVWLKHGRWDLIRISDLLEYVGVNLNRIYSPIDWHGVATLGRWLVESPLFLMAPIATLIFAFAIASALNDEQTNSPPN